MSVGWSYSPLWTGQRGGDWPEPLRRHLAWSKDEQQWPSSDMKREVDWSNSLERGVAWPFARDPAGYWLKTPGVSRDWDNVVDGQTDWPQTFTSKVGGQKYITDQVAQMLVRFPKPQLENLTILWCLTTLSETPPDSDDLSLLRDIWVCFYIVLTADIRGSGRSLTDQIKTQNSPI